MSDKSFKCEYCEKELSSKTNLKVHQEKAKYCLAIQQKQAETLYTCDYCGRDFLHKSSYEKHTKICKVQDKHNTTVEKQKQYQKEQQKTIASNLRKLREQSFEITDLKKQIKQLEQDKHDLERAVQTHLETIGFRDREIITLKEKVAFEKGCMAGYEKNKHQPAITNVKTINKTTTNNVVNQKLAKICVDNIDPFTIETIQNNKDRFTIEKYIQGVPGIVSFIEGITRVTDKNGNINRNYVCTDKPRNSFYQLLDSREWKADDGASCISSVLDVLNPIVEQYDRDMGKIIVSNDKQESEKYKTIVLEMKNVGRGFDGKETEHRDKLMEKVRNSIKEKVLI